jgi:lysophospholipase
LTGIGGFLGIRPWSERAFRRIQMNWQKTNGRYLLEGVEKPRQSVRQGQVKARRQSRTRWTSGFASCKVPSDAAPPAGVIPAAGRQTAGHMRSEEVLLKADDGVELFVRRFRPRFREVDRTIFLVHGMSEHGQCYEHAIDWTVARGWQVIAPDLRGHGRSGGDHIHVNDFSEYVADIRLIFEWSKLSARHTVMVGHSMGGLISARFVQQFPDRVSALALLSPLLGVRVPISPLTVALARLLWLVRPRSRFRKRTRPEHNSRNHEALTREAADPLIRQSVTAAWYFAMRSALRAAWEHAGQIDCPVLVLQAGSDLIVDPQAPHAWLQRVGSPDKTLRVFPEHYHELLNELDWPNTLADMLDWLERRQGGRVEPADEPSPLIDVADHI